MSDKLDTLRINGFGDTANIDIIRKWIDQGDGTHAVLVATALASGQNVILSTLNSSTEKLAAGESFIGTAESILSYAEITISIYSDHPSATDGVQAQFSVDNDHWHTTDEFTHLGLGKFKTWKLQRVAPYFRLVYVNGSEDMIASDHFHITVMYSFMAGVQWSHRVRDDISGEDDAGLIRSILAADQGSNVYSNIGATLSGNLRVTDAENGLAIAKGDVEGTTFVHKFGQAPDFDTGDGEVTVWDGADDGNLNLMSYVYSTTAAIDSISSSNSADTQVVVLQGLNADLELVDQSVTLNGQNRVALTTPLLRVFRGKNNSATAFNGYIYVYENTAISSGVPTDKTKVRLVIQGANNQTLMAVYTIPIDRVGYMRDWYASTAGASKTSQYIIRLWAREYDSVAGSWKAWQLKHVTSISDVGTSYIQHVYEEPERFAGGVDIRMTAQATAVGAVGIAIAAGFDVVLVEN